MRLDERDCIQKAVNGDREAYGTLIDAYQGMVFATALNILGNYSDSEDVVQEAFLRAYQKLETLSDPSRFASWIRTIATRISCTLLQKRKEIAAGDPEGALLSGARSDVESPAEAYARRELSELLWKEVADLPRKTREAVLLYYMEGFSLKRAAEFLGITETAMKTRLHFGREKLHESLERLIEKELHHHQPSKKTRSAILAALPLAGKSLPLSTEAVAAKPTAVVKSSAGLASKKVPLAIAASVLLVTGISVLVLFSFLEPPQGERFGRRPVEGDAGSLPAAFEKNSEFGETPTSGTAPVAEARNSYSISGTARERISDQPVPSLHLELIQKGEVISSTATDSNGVFAFEDLLPGTYELLAAGVPGDLVEDLYLPRSQRKISITIDRRDVEDLTFVFYAASSVRGLVIDQDGMPVPGATLRLTHSDYAPQNSRAISGGEGKFAFRGVYPTAYYRLTTEAEGYPPVEMRGLTVEAAEPLDGVVVRLLRGEFAAISGRVINRQGQPVASTEVTLYAAGNFLASQATGSQGEFEFSQVPSGTVRLGATMLYGPEAARTFEVNAGDAIEGVEIVVDQLIQGGSVSGTLFDTGGKPITTGWVCAWDDGEKARSPLDESGSFRLANLKPGTPVDILYQGHSGPRHPTDATEVPVPAEGLAVTFPESSTDERPRLTIRGQVLDGLSGRPVEQFAVGVGSNNFYFQGTPRAIYDGEGKFELTDVPYSEGRTILFTKAHGHAPHFLAILAEDGETEIEVVVELGPGASIEGRVVNPSGAAVEGARISMVYLNDQYTTTDSLGSFRLSGIGRWATLRVTHPDYAPYEGTPFGESAGIASGSSPAEIKNCVIRLIRGGAVAGVVLDGGGAPRVAVRVGVYRPGDGSPFASGMTGGTGHYRIDRLPPGTVRVSCDGRRLEERVLELSDGQMAQIHFGPVGSTVAGIVSQDGKPLPHISVFLGKTPLDRGGTSLARGQTDENGMFLFHQVPPGTHAIIACRGMRRLGYATVRVRDGEEIRQDISVECGALEGSVRGIDGRVASGARIWLLEKEGGAGGPFSLEPILICGEAVTDSGGRFLFPDVPAGEYRIQAHLAGQGQGSVEATAKAHQTLRGLDILLGGEGRLDVETIDARTGRELELEGFVILLDGKGRLTRKRLVLREGKVTLEELEPGTYTLGAVLEDREGGFYVSPLRIPMVVQRDFTGSVTIPLWPAVEAAIQVVDPSGDPLQDFEVRAFHPEGSPFLVFGPEAGGWIKMQVPPGIIRLMVLRGGTPVFDQAIEIQQRPSGIRFETSVAVREKS